MAGIHMRGNALQPGRPSSKRDKKSDDKDEKGKKGRDEAMGAALRSVYHAAASEPVPDQMLDLLNKLG
ncbi:MAG TPA: NepR family anti-sigma factor [Sphingomonas sp.]